MWYSVLRMIKDVAFLFGETGKAVLAIHGAIPAGKLELNVIEDGITLHAGDTQFLEATGISEATLGLVLNLDEIGVLEATDPDNPPKTVIKIYRR